MTTDDDDAAGFARLLAMELSLKAACDEYLAQVGGDDARVIRAVERTAFGFGGGTPAGAAVWLPAMMDVAAKLGLLNPAAVAVLGATLSSSAHPQH